MSDYLWDKTGEADPEVERLEELLGSLKFQPKPLVLPETITPNAQARRPYLQGLAIAASLLLVSLAGWWLVSHRQDAASKPSTVAQTPNKTDATAKSTEIKDGATSGVKEDAKNVEQPSQQTLAAQPRRRTVLHTTIEKRSVRPEKDFGPATSQQEEASASATPPLSPQELEEAASAKEQLLLALQVASAKLNHAQRKAQTAPNADKISKPEQKPDNQLR